MSGATIANMFLDIMSHDWTDTALLDLELLLDNARNTVLDKEKIMEWANYTLQTKYKPHFSKITKERTPQELYPPGICIHMFRNGVAYSGELFSFQSLLTVFTYKLTGPLLVQSNLYSMFILR